MLGMVRFIFDFETDEAFITETDDGKVVVDPKVIEAYKSLLVEHINNVSAEELVYFVLCDASYMAGQICQLPRGHDRSHN